MKGLCNECKHFKTIESEKLVKLEGKHNMLVNHGNMYRFDDGLYFKGKIEYCCKDRIGSLSMDIEGNVSSCGSYEEKKDDGKEI